MSIGCFECLRCSDLLDVDKQVLIRDGMVTCACVEHSSDFSIADRDHRRGRSLFRFLYDRTNAAPVINFVQVTSQSGLTGSFFTTVSSNVAMLRAAEAFDLVHRDLARRRLALLLLLLHHPPLVATETAFAASTSRCVAYKLSRACLFKTADRRRQPKITVCLKSLDMVLSQPSQR